MHPEKSPGDLDIYSGEGATGPEYIRTVPAGPPGLPGCSVWSKLVALGKSLPLSGLQLIHP